MTNGAMQIAPFEEDFADEMGFFYSFNVEGNRRCAASSRSVRVDRRVMHHGHP